MKQKGLSGSQQGTSDTKALSAGELRELKPFMHPDVATSLEARIKKLGKEAVWADPGIGNLPKGNQRLVICDGCGRLWLVQKKHPATVSPEGKIECMHCNYASMVRHIGKTGTAPPKLRRL